MRAALAEDRLFAAARDASPCTARPAPPAISRALHLAGVAFFLPAHIDASPAPPAIEVELVTSDDLAPSADAPADIPEEPAAEAAMPEAPAAPPAPAVPPQPVAEKQPDEPDAETVAPRPPDRIEQAAPAAAPAVAAATDSEAEAAARRARAKAYASAVSAELNRRRIYPAAARARGIIGAAKVGFTIDAAGHVARFAILASTGHAILDESVARIMQAVRTPPPPEGAFEAVVTIRFGLR